MRAAPASNLRFRSLCSSGRKNGEQRSRTCRANDPGQVKTENTNEHSNHTATTQRLAKTDEEHALKPWHELHFGAVPIGLVVRSGCCGVPSSSFDAFYAASSSIFTSGPAAQIFGSKAQIGEAEERGGRIVGGRPAM